MPTHSPGGAPAMSQNIQWSSKFQHMIQGEKEESLQGVFPNGHCHQVKDKLSSSGGHGQPDYLPFYPDLECRLYQPLIVLVDSYTEGNVLYENYAHQAFNPHMDLLLLLLSLNHHEQMQFHLLCP